MKQTLENLWNGHIRPCENCGSNDPELAELVRLMEANQAALDTELTPPQKTTLEKLIACAEEYLYLLTAQAFSDGFCLASKLLTEALSTDVIL